MNFKTAVTFRPAAQPLLDIRSLCFGYGKQLVLDHVDLQLHRGEIVAITGPSGSGKSTLLALAGFLRRPPRGQVFHWGLDAGAASRRELSERRRRVRFVFQRPYLMKSLTVLENVVSGVLLSHEPDSVLKRRALGLLELLGTAHLRDRWPEQISGGEQQRVALARAVISRPEILLADEPTASLDHASAMTVMAKIHELAQQEDCGILITTHDPRIFQDIRRRVSLV